MAPLKYDAIIRYLLYIDEKNKFFPVDNRLGQHIILLENTVFIRDSANSICFNFHSYFRLFNVIKITLFFFGTAVVGKVIGFCILRCILSTVLFDGFIRSK